MVQDMKGLWTDEEENKINFTLMRKAISISVNSTHHWHHLPQNLELTPPSSNKRRQNWNPSPILLTSNETTKDV